MELEGIAPATIVHDYKRLGFLFQAAWSPTLIPSTSDGNRASTNQGEVYYSSLIGPQEINFGDIAVAARKHRLLIAYSGYHDDALQQASGTTTFDSYGELCSITSVTEIECSKYRAAVGIMIALQILVQTEGMAQPTGWSATVSCSLKSTLIDAFSNSP
jgi:hypothetical protein